MIGTPNDMNDLVINRRILKHATCHTVLNDLVRYQHMLHCTEILSLVL